MLRSFAAVREEDLLAGLHRIMNSRHPKVDYYVGIHPFLYDALNALSSTVFEFVQRWI